MSAGLETLIRMPWKPDSLSGPLDGAVEHLEARLAGTAAAAGGEDHEVGVGAIGVLAHADGEGVAEAGGQVLEVKRLGARGVLVDAG